MRAFKTKQVIKCFCCGEEVRIKDTYCDYCGSRIAALNNKTKVSAAPKKDDMVKSLLLPSKR
jgi:rRNA maturation endonuclease Nob1